MRPYRLAVVLLASTVFAADIHFEPHTLADNLTGGYQVVAADLNHDGRPDLIALASGMTDLVWFENPGRGQAQWARHLLATGLPGMINCAPWDIDGDGIPEIAVAYGFSMNPTKSAGDIVLLTHLGDPRQPWKASPIEHLPASHRLRWADIDGNGKRVLVDAPLANEHATPPDFRGHVPLVYYGPGEWKRTLISDAEQGVMHGIYIVDWDHTGRDDILIASFLGIHLYKPGRDGAWSRTEIAKGNPAPWPKSGSSDVAVGHIGKERFIAAIEPWHGNQVVVYREQHGSWPRQVIDPAILDGHTIVTADFDGDGNDEIVAGYRGKPYGVNLYKLTGTKWTRSVIDEGGVSAAACAAADLDGDGRVDLACIGTATHNLKWYRNAAP